MYDAHRYSYHTCLFCTLQKAGVPTVPGSEGLITNDTEAMEVAKAVGFPLMIKATAGQIHGSHQSVCL